MLCCPVRRQIGADYTDFSLEESETCENGPKRADATVVSSRFDAALSPTTKSACDYTNWPEVTRVPPVAVDAGRAVRVADAGIALQPPSSRTRVYRTGAAEPFDPNRRGGTVQLPKLRKQAKTVAAGCQAVA
jgi:hypothetical protein